MQSIHLYPRGHPSTSPIYIAGFCAIGLVILGLVIWLGVRQCRKRLQVKREDERVGAFLSVRGLVTEVEGERVPSST
jgi:hypothetical protein